MPSFSPLSITALGLACSLGTDAVLACAAARAGLTRVRDLPFTVKDEETNEDEPVSGHPVPGLTAGFEGQGRLLRLMQLGLADLATRMPDDPLADAPYGCVLVLPDPPLAEDPAYEIYADDRAQTWPAEPLTQLVRACLSSPGPDGLAPQVQTVHRVGEAEGGVAAAFQRAAAWIEAGPCARCIVGAVDSLVHPRALRSLQADDRLKTPDQPAGLMPGEASAFVLLERQVSTPPTGPLGILTQVHIGDEPNHRETGEPPLGRGLAEVLQAAFEDAAPSTGPDADVPWLLSDHNGEPYRAAELGHALMRLCASAPRYQQTEIWYPALHVGDTGLASGLVGLSLVLRAFARGYKPARHAVIATSGDGRARTTFCVQDAS
ncbi:MAG: hypothetical protein AAGI71_04740 [Bacteroidota bacterium]